MALRRCLVGTLIRPVNWLVWVLSEALKRAANRLVGCSDRRYNFLFTRHNHAYEVYHISKIAALYSGGGGREGVQNLNVFEKSRGSQRKIRHTVCCSSLLYKETG